MSEKAMSKARARRAECGYEYGSKSLVAMDWRVTELFIISEIACISY